jgi:EmrB/QacA subfamily drug resistance transporter
MFQTLSTRQDGRARGGVRLQVDAGKQPPPAVENPWNALWAMLVGFFMILVDATIVAVANPSIMDKLGASYDSVIWVTSAYLLAYAVPLLVAGRLGDRFGPKNLYLLGLTIFTAASLWCGLADSIEMLIAARVVQGIGAALLTPQTLSTITRIFPADRRGVAMSVWGATAGVATLVGPLAGGVLVDRLGWQWIFFVNVPVGIIGLALAVWLIPVLPTSTHRFDLLGVLLSGIGMFMIVFALQEGQSHDWAPWIWGTIAGGIGFMAAFLIWQYVNTSEPLIPLVVFRDRDFSLSNVGVATIGFVATATFLPLMFYAQAVCGLSPTRSALLTAPMAVATGVLAPFVGKIVDRSHPRPVIGFGFSVLAIAMTWLSIEMTPTTPIWRLVLPITAMGIGSAFIWAPLAATATRNLPPKLAGAGSGVYNTTRQVGSVLGSAGMAAFMTSRISAEMPPMPAQATQGEGAVTRLPTWLHDPFAAAMSQSMLLPAFFALFGVVAAVFLLGFGNADRLDDDDDLDDADRNAGYAVEYGGDGAFVDDDEYLEYEVRWDEDDPAESADPEPVTRAKPVVRPEPVVQEPVQAEPVVQADDSVTEPMRSHADHLLHAPAEAWHSAPVDSWRHLPPDDEPEEVEPEPEPEPDRESWRGILDQLLTDVPPVKPKSEPIGFAHNGFHVDEEERFQPLPPPAPEPPRPPRHERPSRHERSARHERPLPHERPSRHYLPENQPQKRPFWFESNGKHSRDDPDDAPRYGRHSTPGRD